MDGRALAKKREELLRNKLSKLARSRKPAMVSFCNTEDPPSVKYTKMKRGKASDIGMDFIVEEYTEQSGKDEIIKKVQGYNRDENIDGIMFQMPLPGALDKFRNELLTSIDPQKDVDGLIEDGPFVPATVKAVISIMEEYIPNWKTKNIAVVGSSGEVGRPLVKLLNKQGIDPVCINSKEGNLETDMRNSGIVISATGKKDLIRPEMIQEGVVLIDVGLGDFEEGCYRKASLYTPILGGVGPMTVISLMENAVESFEKRLSDSDI